MSQVFKRSSESLKPLNFTLTKARGSTAFIVLTIVLAGFSDTFLYGVIIPVIPFAFQSRMGVERAYVESWISKSLALYSLGLLLGAIIVGYVSDKMKQRRYSMLGGLVIVCGSCLILCLTKSLPFFMVGRFIQGLAASVVWTVGLAVLAETAGHGQVAYLMGYTAIGLNVGGFAGPLVGGAVYQKAGYYSVFYVCFGILGLDTILRLLMIEKKQLKKKMNSLNSGNSDIALESHSLEADGEHFTESSAEHNNHETQSDEENGASSRNKKHLYCIRRVDTLFGYKIPGVIGLLKHSSILVSLFQSFVLSWIMAAFESTMTLHLNNTFNFKSLASSLMFLALIISTFVEPLVGKISDKFGPRYLVTLGFLLFTPFLMILKVPHGDTGNQIAIFAAFLALNGFAISLIFSPVMSELFEVVSMISEKQPDVFGPSRGLGQTYGLFNVAYSLGGLVGPFHGGAVYSKSGWGTLMMSLGIITAITAIPTFLFTGGNILRQWRNKERAD